MIGFKLVRLTDHKFRSCGGSSPGTLPLTSYLLHNDEAHDDGISEMHPLRRDIDCHPPRCAPEPTLFTPMRLGNLGVGADILKLEGDRLVRN